MISSKRIDPSFVGIKNGLRVAFNFDGSFLEIYFNNVSYFYKKQKTGP